MMLFLAGFAGSLWLMIIAQYKLYRPLTAAIEAVV